MATWQEIGIDNFRAAVALYDGGYYRNATSRFYYAAFSVLTHELIRRGARPAFRDNRATPGHAQLPLLMTAYLSQFSRERLENLIGYVGNLYRYRIAADYSLQRMDKSYATKAFRAAEKIFRYLEVTHERKGSS